MDKLGGGHTATEFKGEVLLVPSGRSDTAVTQKARIVNIQTPIRILNKVIAYVDVRKTNPRSRFNFPTIALP